MNASSDFQSNLPTDLDLNAIRHQAAQLQAAHIKSLIGRIGAALFPRHEDVLPAAAQRS